MAKEDEQAVVQIATRREDRLLSEPVLRAMLLRSPDAGESYAAKFAELGARAPQGGTSPRGGFQDSLLTALGKLLRVEGAAPLLEGRAACAGQDRGCHRFRISPW